MTQQEIIEMSRQAGMAYEDDTNRYIANIDDLQDFAKLVRNDYSNKHAQLWLKRIDDAVKAEREACANVCEEHGKVWAERFLLGYQATLDDAADAIRARGNA